MGFKVYSGALYAPKNTANLDAAPKRLTLHYYRSIDRKTIVVASWEVLADNPEVDLTALRPRLERLMTFINSVKEGDRYAVTYAPGKGTTLSVNNEPLGTIEGADFAAAYYTIWLGAKPISEKMRDELTGTTNRK